MLTGDANDVLPPHGPFDLIFADSGIRDAAAFGALTGLLKPGGRIVMDDLTPVQALPASSPLLASDAKRNLFAGEERLTWTEVVLPDLANSLLVGTRRGALPDAARMPVSGRSWRGARCRPAGRCDAKARYRQR